MAKPQNNALQIIFSFFLGLMVLAFIGIGVYTFYPSPEKPYQATLDKLYRQQQQIDSTRKASGNLTPAKQAEYDQIQKKIDAVNKRLEAKREIWARNTSIILIIFATIVMAISLIRSEELRVISNGLLLGGVFTMLYGVGWVIFSGESVARFIVIVVAFAITIALGYVKFVRERGDETGQPLDATAALAGAGGADLSALVARIDALERRQAAAAAALGESGREER